jgi:Zn-dependent alcohol dehydrogenase
MPRPSGFRPGDSVAVVGVGPVGLVHAAKAALLGASEVIAIDRFSGRLDIAAVRLLAGEPADILVVPRDAWMVVALAGVVVAGHVRISFGDCIDNIRGTRNFRERVVETEMKGLA